MIEHLLNKTHCMDNLAGLALLPDESIDLVVTSPPYDNLRTYGGYEWCFEKVAAELVRVMKSGAVIVWVIGDAIIDYSETGTSFEQALYFKKSLGLKLYDTMIYKKPGPPFPETPPIRYSQVFEYMFILSKGKPKTTNILHDKPNVRFEKKGRLKIGRQKDGSIKRELRTKDAPTHSSRFNIWEYTRDNKLPSNKHPAVFPYQLAVDHIVTWSNPWDIVLDPFMGSGTTARAAKNNNRHYVGFEINPDYMDLCEINTAQSVLDIAG